MTTQRNTLVKLEYLGMFFQRVGDAHELLRGVGVNGNQHAGNHGKLSFHHFHALAFESFTHGVEVGHGSAHFPGVVVVLHVVGAGFEHHVHHGFFVRILFLVQGDHAEVIELERHGTAFAHGSAVLREHVTHFGHGAVLVVGGGFHNDGHAARAVAFVHDFGDVAARVLTGALADGGFNLVLGQVHGLGGGDGGTQTGIAGRVPTALGGDDDFLGGLGECLASLGVLSTLAKSDVCPFVMSRHVSLRNKKVFIPEQGP